MFCITIEHKSSCRTKIFYYNCKILFVTFLLKRFMANFFFFWNIVKITEYFDNVWSCPLLMIVSTLGDFPKVLKSTCRKLMFICTQKLTSSLTSLLRYWKDIANLLFWELWECMNIPSIIIASACRKFSSLSTCKKSTSSLTFSLRYCKEIANLLF